MSSDFCNNYRERSSHVERGPIDSVLNAMYPYEKNGTIIEYEGNEYRRQWYRVRSRSGKSYSLVGTWHKFEHGPISYYTEVSPPSYDLDDVTRDWLGVPS